jgi:hypothetical protein
VSPKRSWGSAADVLCIGDRLIGVREPEMQRVVRERGRDHHHLGLRRVGAVGQGLAQLPGGDRLAGQSEQLHHPMEPVGRHVYIDWNRSP